jgi:hypothetical protein
MSASSSDKLNQSFSKIVDHVSLRVTESASSEGRLAAVRSWLEDDQSEHKRKWLLILDNAVEDTVNTLREYLPRGNANGRILVTTRTERISKLLATSFGKEHDCIGLGKLDMADCVSLLARQSGVQEINSQRSEQHQMAREIAKLVGFLPLAVDQAASLIPTLPKGIYEAVDVFRKQPYKVEVTTLELTEPQADRHRHWRQKTTHHGMKRSP